MIPIAPIGILTAASLSISTTTGCPSAKAVAGVESATLCIPKKQSGHN